MEALLDYGAHSNIASQECKTLLYTYVSSKDMTAVKLLLKHDTNLSAKLTGASNQLPLHTAVTVNNLELVNLNLTSRMIRKRHYSSTPSRRTVYP